MPADNVEIVRRIYEAETRGDLEAVLAFYDREEALEAAGIAE